MDEARRSRSTRSTMRTWPPTATRINLPEICDQRERRDGVETKAARPRGTRQTSAPRKRNDATWQRETGRDDLPVKRRGRRPAPTSCGKTPKHHRRARSSASPPKHHRPPLASSTSPLHPSEAMRFPPVRSVVQAAKGCGILASFRSPTAPRGFTVRPSFRVGIAGHSALEIKKEKAMQNLFRQGSCESREERRGKAATAQIEDGIDDGAS